MGIWRTIVEAIAKDTADVLIPQAVEAIVSPVMATAAVMSDQKVVVHHVINGGCGEDFATAMRECHPSPPEWFMQERGNAADRVVDAKACVKATAALRKCFARNTAMFKHQYLCRLDEGLDQDTKPSPELIKEEERDGFRWWTGMRRN